VILCKNKLYFGNKNDYCIVFGMWATYISLSVLFFFTLNNYVKDEYHPIFGIIPYFLSVPGMIYAVKCFACDPGIVASGDLPDPNHAIDSDPIPAVDN
jgi:cadmium resistance protein CadD (predicted permease)